MKYNPKLVLAFWRGCGIEPAPVAEYRFAPPRKWRFDFAWPLRGTDNLTETTGSATMARPCNGLALEVQGGIWTRGRHTRGAALVQEYEKLSEAAALGWRVLFCTPDQLMSMRVARLIKRALRRE